VDSFFVDFWNKLSLPDLLPRLISPMVTTGLAFANLGQGGANLLPPFWNIGAVAKLSRYNWEMSDKVLSCCTIM